MEVFVSSTYDDLKQYREAVGRMIENLGHKPIMMERFIPNPDTAKNESLRYVADSELFIGIYAHKYGSIPEGDSISLCEQEYHCAIKNKIPVYLFILDPNCEWPNEQIEGDPDHKKKLRKFINLIRKNHLVREFAKPEDILINLAPILGTRFDSSTELQKWQLKAKDIKASKKLEVINNLFQEYNQKKLTPEALVTIAELITSDFKPNTPPSSPELIDMVGRLLENGIHLSFFDKEASKLSKKSLFSKFLANWYVAVGFVILGLILGICSYRFNWFGVRVKYLAGENANSMDVIEWLITEQVERNIVLDDLKAPGTQKALFALRMAYEIDNESPKIDKYIERHIRDIRKLTRIGEPSYRLLENNLRVLEEICMQVSFPTACKEAEFLENRLNRLADSLRASVLTDSLNNILFYDSAISDSVLLSGYKNLIQSYSDHVDTIDIEQRIAKLTESISEFKQQLALMKSDTLTIAEALSSWQIFSKSQFRPSPAKTKVAKQINRLEYLLQSTASIKTPDDILTCRNVENLQPQGVSKIFSPGKVYVWARINAPRSERITVKWYANGGLFYVRSINITKSSGYRVYFSKIYGSENQGRNEVRLYNGENLLIGRQVFWVRASAGTTKQ